LWGLGAVGWGWGLDRFGGVVSIPTINEGLRPLVDHGAPGFSVVGVVIEAGPWVVFGFEDEAAGHGIAVKIAKLFDTLFVGEHIEVVIAGQPERLFGKLLRDGTLEGAEDGGERWVGGSESRRWTCSGMTT
jgi:hypothetical protein